MRVFATGAMTLALMFFDAPSTARTRVKPTRAIFAAPVIRLPEVTEDAGARCCADHSAVVLLAHVRPGRRGDEVGAVEVDVDDRCPQFRRHVVERLVAKDAGVVDHDVDAPEGIECRLDDRRAALGRRHGVRVGDRFATGGRDLVDDPLGSTLVAPRAVDGAGRGRSPRSVHPGGHHQGVLAAKAAPRPVMIATLPSIRHVQVMGRRSPGR